MEHWLIERHIIFGEPTYVGKNKEWRNPNRVVFSKESLDRIFKFHIMEDKEWMDITKIYKTLNKMEEF